MSDESESGGLEILRAWIGELVRNCEDADLLDLVYKMLLIG